MPLSNCKLYKFENKPYFLSILPCDDKHSVFVGMTLVHMFIIHMDRGSHDQHGHYHLNTFRLTKMAIGLLSFV